MSGLEIIGIAANIIQIADLGTKLSVKLFTFYRQIQSVNQSVQSLASDVALTSAILHELGKSLEQDGASKLCSKEAYGIMQVVMKQCTDVLHQIQNEIHDPDAQERSRWQKATDKLRNVLNESNVNFLKENLEKLKSTMLLLLNVIMCAGQIRNNNVSTMLYEQRELIEKLLEEQKKSNQGQHQPLKVVLPRTGPSGSKTNVSTVPINSRSISSDKNELDEYDTLIRKMLHEIDCCKLKLDKARRSRIRGGVLSIHSNEIVQFQRTHGPWIFTHFEDSLFDSEPATKPESNAGSEQRNSREDIEFEFIPTPDVRAQAARSDSSLVLNDPKDHVHPLPPESEDGDMILAGTSELQEFTVGEIEAMNHPFSGKPSASNHTSSSVSEKTDDSIELVESGLERLRLTENSSNPTEDPNKLIYWISGRESVTHSRSYRKFQLGYQILYPGLKVKDYGPWRFALTPGRFKSITGKPKGKNSHLSNLPLENRASSHEGDTSLPDNKQVSPEDSEHNEHSTPKTSKSRPIIAAGLGSAALHGLYEKERRRKQIIGGPILVSASRASTPDDEQLQVHMQGSSAKDYESIVTSFGAADFQSLMLRWTTLDKSELDKLNFFSGFDASNVPSFEVQCTS